VADSFPAITIWQPWATLIAEGAKRYEFRSWAPAGRMVGRRIAIHAGARKANVGEMRELLYRLQMGEAAQTGIDPATAIPILDAALQAPRSLPLSSVLCTAVLGRPLRNQELAAALGTEFINDSDRNQHSNYGWPLTKIQKVVPFAPAKGSQGWWEWRPAQGGDHG